MTQQSLWGYISQRIESRVLKGDLHTSTQSSTIHISQEVKATQMSIDRWMDKQSVVYAYNAIIFSLKKEGSSVTHYNMNESWGHYAKSVTKRQAHLHGVSKVVTVIETDWWLLGAGWREGEERDLLFRGYRVSVPRYNMSGEPLYEHAHGILNTTEL